MANAFSVSGYVLCAIFKGVNSTAGFGSAILGDVSRSEWVLAAQKRVTYLVTAKKDRWQMASGEKQEARKSTRSEGESWR